MIKKTIESRRVQELVRTFKSAKIQTTLPYRKFVILIALVPKGSVASYGQIADLAGSPGHARQVVRALHSSSKKHDLPWHRIINSQGKIGIRNKLYHLKQKALLQSEGVEFEAGGRVDFEQFGWKPKRSELRWFFETLA